MLKEQGLIKGGGLDNAVVIIDKIDSIEMDRLKDLFGWNIILFKVQMGS